MADPIRFIDIQLRHTAEKARLTARSADLKVRKLNAEGNRVAALAALPILDPVYLGAQIEFERTGQPIANESDGTFVPVGNPPQISTRDRAFAAVYGILRRDGDDLPPFEEVQPPTFNGLARTVAVAIAADDFAPAYKALAQRAANARGEYNAHSALYDKVLQILADAGIIRVGDNDERHVDAEQFATVVRVLIDQGVSPADRHLPLKAELALGSVTGGDREDGGTASATVLDPFDFEAVSDVEIVADNLKGMQGVHLAATLEEMKVFQVVDKLVDLFQQGMLPLGRGRAGDRLFSLWKKSVNRMSEFERRNLYARTFGFPGGDPQVPANREFGDLWLRFVSAVATYYRQFTVNDLLTAKLPIPVNQEQIRKSGRDLAANLSLHGYGVVYFAATELQRTINDMVGVLTDPEIKSSFGARDMWQVIDQVATLELGGARNGVRYRTMAESGQIIIRWLSDHSKELASARQLRILDDDAIRSNAPRPAGTKATTDPTDLDLLNACVAFLAVTGIQDAQVELYSQPIEGPAMTSRPIAIPQVARDMLASVGIAPMAAGVGSNGSS